MLMTAFVQTTMLGTLLIYVAASISYFISSKNERIGRMAFGLSLIGLIFNLVVLIGRIIISGRLPLASGFEFILNFTFIIVLFHLIYQVKSGVKIGGGIVMLIASLLLLSIEIIMPGQVGDNTPLMPALKSSWLTAHVLTAVVSYSGFALAAGLAVVQIRGAFSTEREEAIYRIVAMSFALLSVSIILGAIWAEQAWGSYWSWDPKETWALITWIIYVAYLHLHRQAKWQERSAWLVIGGFLLVLFTFFGVNFLMSGLHSYA